MIYVLCPGDRKDGNWDFRGATAPVGDVLQASPSLQWGEGCAARGGGAVTGSGTVRPGELPSQSGS